MSGFILSCGHKVALVNIDDTRELDNFHGYRLQDGEAIVTMVSPLPLAQKIKLYKPDPFDSIEYVWDICPGKTRFLILAFYYHKFFSFIFGFILL